MQGHTGPKGKGDEVQISKFSLTDKQRELRDALSKRLVLSESHIFLVLVSVSFFVSLFLFLLSCYCYSVSSIFFFSFLFF